MTHDELAASRSDRQIRRGRRLIDLPETITLAFDRTELPKDRRNEPLVSTAIIARFPETARLDPKRVDLNPETTSPKDRAWRGPISSLLFHLLPLLALISWLRPPLDIPPPIPVQLVIEQPPPPPPPPAKPAPQVNPPPGLHASDDFGEVGPPGPQRGKETTPPTKGEPPQPAAQQAQTAPTPPDPPVEAPKPTPAPPPPPPAETPQPAPALAPPPPPKPAPPKQQTAALPSKLEGLELPLPLRPDHPQQEALASARFPGPNATRDEYCAYALSLTLEHIDLLPRSLLGARRGDVTVMIHVREDGTIVNASVMRGSGYLDIDERVVAMVKAVKQFPAFPLWLRGPVADFTLHLHFPNPAQQ
jgi:protein TonB